MIDKTLKYLLFSVVVKNDLRKLGLTTVTAICITDWYSRERNWKFTTSESLQLNCLK